MHKLMTPSTIRPFSSYVKNRYSGRTATVFSISFDLKLQTELKQCYALIQLV